VTFSVGDLGDDFLLTAQTVTSINPVRMRDLMRAALERLGNAPGTAPGTAAAAIDALPEAERIIRTLTPTAVWKRFWFVK
jgi:hypothetical protein